MFLDNWLFLQYLASYWIKFLYLLTFHFFAEKNKKNFKDWYFFQKCLASFNFIFSEKLGNNDFFFEKVKLDMRQASR